MNIFFWAGAALRHGTPVSMPGFCNESSCATELDTMNSLFYYISSDLIMNFFVAYENPVTGELITDHRKIANKYLRGWFIIDLLATFPSDYIVKAVQVRKYGCLD